MCVCVCVCVCVYKFSSKLTIDQLPLSLYPTIYLPNTLSLHFHIYPTPPLG